MTLFLFGQYLSICAMTVSHEAVFFYALRLTSHGLYLLLAEMVLFILAFLSLFDGPERCYVIFAGVAFLLSNIRR
jgi:hypothetical protein